ncbi:hypothetical protein BC826DRAFT_960564 [Russula brevipes]|nr:hypothetical protein BC826DRAFT_960564 [Russula brevipes]
MLPVLLTKLLLFFFFLASLSHGEQESLQKNTRSDHLCTCRQIAAAISGALQVFFPPAPQYWSDISHYSPSSSEVSACSVEPGSAEDVSTILRILGSSRTPFAVKSGGHASNPGFCSTTGVQIAMSRFNETKVNSAVGTVEVWRGLTWDQLYVGLGPAGVNVVGGRTSGVGVAGLTLGGGECAPSPDSPEFHMLSGYSFKTSQY